MCFRPSLCVLQRIFLFRPEKGEVHAAVGAVFHEAGVGGEVVRFAVFQHEEAVFLQQAVPEDQVGQRRQVVQGVGRVGKDEVESLVAFVQEAEHVGPQQGAVRGFQGIHHLADEFEMLGVALHRDHPSATAREQLDGDAARAGEQVQCHGAFLEIQVAVEHVEQVLFRKVRRGPCLEVVRHVEVPAFVNAGDDSHVACCVFLFLYDVSQERQQVEGD